MEHSVSHNNRMGRKGQSMWIAAGVLIMALVALLVGGIKREDGGRVYAIGS